MARHNIHPVTKFVALIITTLTAQHCLADTCASPPFGDTQQKYDFYLTLPFASPALVSKACEAKFNNEGRQAFYDAGITDAELDKFSPSELAQGYLQRLGAKGMAGDFKQLSVEDFILDGEDLANDQTNVSLSGAYISSDGLNYLFVSSQAIVYQLNSTTQQPHILLLTEHASRPFRQKLLNCAKNPNFPQLGCAVQVQGNATMCVVTNQFGTERNEPCVNVTDGR